MRATAPEWVVAVAVPSNGPANPATDALLTIAHESASTQGTAPTPT
ncbi:hypothetical protein [Actinoallomurus sp. CA-142502]